MLKQVLTSIGLAAAALVVVPAASVSQAAGTQNTVWKANGLQQTSSQYWEPTLGSTTSNTNGRAFIKITVTSKPSSKAVQPAVCFWRDEGSTKNKYETCAGTNGVTFTGTGTFYIDLGTPNTWWKKNGVYDWSKQASRGRIMIKNPGTSGKLLLSSRCGQACYPGNDLNQHIPITMSSELIFVAKGEKLSCPSDWNTSLCGTGGGGGGTTPPPTNPPPTTAPPTTAPPTTSPGGGTPTTTAPSSGSATPTIDVTAGNGSFAVAWDHPQADLFQFRYKATNTQKWEWDRPAKTNARTVTGLVNGQRYDVQVRAYFDGKWNPWGSTVASPNGSGSTPTTTTPTTTTPGGSGGGGATVIEATTTTPKVTVTPGARSLTTTWSHPVAKLFQFRYQAEGTNGWDWIAPTRTSSKTVTGLSSGQDYTVQVRAYVNGSWKGWASATVAAG